MHKGKKILLIDDDLDVIATLEKGLVNYGFEVNAYNDPISALSNFESGFYDLVITDIRMQSMTGFELCEKIREKDRFIKICFVPAFESYYKSLLEEYRNMDCKCFIKKPIAMQDLVKCIEQELGI